jgi:hypothetical protein
MAARGIRARADRRAARCPSPEVRAAAWDSTPVSPAGDDVLGGRPTICSAAHVATHTGIGVDPARDPAHGPRRDGRRRSDRRGMERCLVRHACSRMESRVPSRRVARQRDENRTRRADPRHEQAGSWKCRQELVDELRSRGAPFECRSSSTSTTGEATSGVNHIVQNRKRRSHFLAEEPEGPLPWPPRVGWSFSPSDQLLVVRDRHASSSRSSARGGPKSRQMTGNSAATSRACPGRGSSSLTARFEEATSSSIVLDPPRGRHRIERRTGDPILPPTYRCVASTVRSS